MVQTRVINPFPGLCSNPTSPHSCRRALLEELFFVQSHCANRKFHFLELTNSLRLHKFFQNLFKMSFDERRGSKAVSTYHNHNKKKTFDTMVNY